MQSFIDLEGASGATYRFHRVDDLTNLPAIAGNFAYVQGDGPRPVALHVREIARDGGKIGQVVDPVETIGRPGRAFQIDEALHELRHTPTA